MRHGQTLFNVYRRIQGWCDSPLTEVGINQAIAARKLIEGINFDHYYCSTAERASDTLELVTEGKVPYTRLKGLKERYFGVFEGQSEDLNPPWELPAHSHHLLRHPLHQNRGPGKAHGGR